MSVFNSPVPSDEIVAQDVSQILDALNATLGILDTAQDALGRLVLPSGISHPGTPSSFQQWVRSDLGDGGRLFMRHTNSSGQNVPYMPLRQVVRSADLGASINTTNTSLTDATGLSVSITTTGGRLRIKLVPGLSYAATAGHISVETTGVQFPNGAFLAAVIGAVTIGETGVGSQMGSAASGLFHNTPCSSFEWDYKPPAPGTYTVKIQYRVTGASMRVTIANNVALLVEEWGD